MDPIEIALRQKGAEAVKNALRGVVDAIEELDQASARSAEASSRARITALRREISERKRLASTDDGGGAGKRGGGRGRGGTRDAFERATGGGGGSRGSGGAMVSRATKGPTMGEYAGLASSGVGSIMGTIGKFGAVGGAIALFKGAIDLASSALEQFGGFLISDVIKPAFALETAAAQLENASGGQIKAAEIQEKTRSAALKHNMDPMALFEAASKMIDLTGDPQSSFKLLDTIGMLAKGRGADAGELADFAASLKNFDPNASADQISSLLMTQLAQGDMGSVPLKEAARLGGRLTAPAAMLAGNTDVKMASMGALLQSGRKGFGSTDELATGIGNLINEVSSQKMVGSKKYLNADGQIGDVASLISGILKDTGGDAKKIGALGLSDPASKLVKAYLPKFNEGGKGATGATAVEDQIRSFMKANTTLASERDNERKVLQTSGEKWNSTIEQLKNKLLDVMPEVQKFVDQFAQIAPQFGGALVTLAKIMIKVATFLSGLFGTTDEDINTDKATGDARGEYRMNLESGQFEWIKQSQLNKEKEGDIFGPDYKGKGLSLKGAASITDPAKPGASPGPAPVLAPLLAGAGVAPAVVSPSVTSTATMPSASGDKPVLMVDKMNTQLDALAPKLGKLGEAFDKLALSGANVERTTPLSKR